MAFLKSKFRRNRWHRLFGYKTSFPRRAVFVSIVSWVCVFLVVGYAAYRYRNVRSTVAGQFSDSGHHPSWNSRRHLLASTATSSPNATYQIYTDNCTLKNVSVDAASGHGPVWERCDAEKSTQLTGLFIFLYSFFTIVTFIAVAIVCDDFFVPTLEGISEKLELSEDVAGATFMAAGSSAPELFSSIAGVAFNSDVGVGTITGSAVFNLLVIISLTAAFAGKVLHLDWRPLVRDSVFYSLSIAVFIWSVWNTFFEWYEATIMVFLYILYIIIMAFNEKLMNCLGSWGGKCCCASIEPADSEQGDVAMETVRSESHSNLNGMANNTQGTRGSVDSRRMSTLSHQSLSGEAKIFRHDRRNSVIHTLATSRPSLRGDEKIGASGKRGSILPSLETANTKLNMHTLKEETSTGSEEDTEKNGNLKRTSTDVVNETIHEDKEPSSSEGNAPIEVGEEDEEEEEEEEEMPHMNCCCSCCPVIRGAPPPKPTEEDSGPGATVLYVLKWIIFVLAFPFLCLFSLTIPDCSTKEHKTTCRVLGGFFLSVLWIAAISFCMVTIVARTGCLIGVDSFVMSLVVLAAGTSIPDLLSSIIVARDGYGDMAVSNAIGSNVFDINLGLGFPFLIRILSDKGRPFSVFSVTERYHYCRNEMLILPHPKFGFILLCILALALTVFTVARFRLNRLIGISFFILYIFFLVYAFSQEFLCNKTGKYNC